MSAYNKIETDSRNLQAGSYFAQRSVRHAFKIAIFRCLRKRSEKCTRHYLTRAVVIGAILLSPAVNAQIVDPETVEALRQMAIAAGQTSSSGKGRPASSPETVKAKRSAIESHRAAFFARINGRASKKRLFKPNKED